MKIINSPQDKFLFGYLHLYLVSIMMLFFCPLFGQVIQKKHLLPADYRLWADVHLDKISPDEKWASYNVTRQTSGDTLFVRNLQNSQTYPFAGGNNSVFTKGGYFICQDGKQLAVLNLKTGKKEIIQGVKQYTYCQPTDQLIYLVSVDNQSNLVIRSVKGESREITNVIHFTVSPKFDQLVYVTDVDNKRNLSLINLKSIGDSKSILIDTIVSFTNLTWQKEGRSLAFTLQAADKSIRSLFYYIVEKGKLYQFDPSKQPNFPANAGVDSYNWICISDDLKKVFFKVSSSFGGKKDPQNLSVEIWNANDKRTYKADPNRGTFEKTAKTALWLPESNQFISVTSNELPEIMIAGNFDFAVLSNPLDYEPQFEQSGPKDYYLMNLKTTEKSIFLKKQDHTYYNSLSPTGKYFAYFKDNNWWVYNISANTHTNITIATGGKFKAKIIELEPESVVGNPGWSTDDKEIILYDQYDIWAITPDGKSFKRLTRGRESGIRFKITKSANKSARTIYDGKPLEVYDLNGTLLLRARGDNGKTGYYKWSTNTADEPLFYANSYTDEFYYSGNGNSIFLREQRFDLSPRLIRASSLNRNQSFYQSNPQQAKYFWGRSELIEYRNTKGQQIKAVLIYPANYDPKKKYPMIVNTYEMQSFDLHFYDQPTLENEGAFNPTVFSTMGYFVLLPDVVFEKGNPGLSAADCVIAATKKVIEMGIVDPSKIGLNGHSFGGYEVAFIVTQTNMFASAVASGGIADLISCYHSLNSRGIPEMWRFETEQWNMGGTPYELPLAYQANSPIMHVQNVQTPVLIWTGKKDPQVDPNQSMEFYLALRRLDKQCIMLLYPNEGHVLSNAANQIDATNRLIQWFDYYLKGEKPAEWITKGTN